MHIYDNLSLKFVSDKSCTENLNTHFVFNNFFFTNRFPTQSHEHTVEKYCSAGKATDDNTAHAHCTLDT